MADITGESLEDKRAGGRGDAVAGPPGGWCFCGHYQAGRQGEGAQPKRHQYLMEGVVAALCLASFCLRIYLGTQIYYFILPFLFSSLS